MRSVTRFTLVILVVLATSIGLWAQAGTGAVSGVVFDPTGAVVANAQVTLVNQATGVARKTQPTAAGVYTFSAVPVGTYTVSVTAPGFKESKAVNLVVSTGATHAEDIHLQVGGTKETVTVEAGVMGVQTTDSSVSQLIGADLGAPALGSPQPELVHQPGCRCDAGRNQHARRVGQWSPRRHRQLHG